MTTRRRLQDEIASALETLHRAEIIRGLGHLCREDTDTLNASYDTYNALPRCNNGTSSDADADDDDADALVTRNIIGAFVTLCCIAIAAGLFLGLMTLDVLDLQIIVARNNADDKQVVYAKTLLPLVKDRHRLLVTLLLMDTLA